MWASRLQTQVSLSTTETKYVALSQPLEVILFMNLLNKFKSKGFNIVNNTPIIVCTTFKDNNGAIKISNIPKICAQTKHINLVYRNFHEQVIQKKIVIKPIDASYQMANIFTKPLCYNLCLRYRTSMLHF